MRHFFTLCTISFVIFLSSCFIPSETTTTPPQPRVVRKYNPAPVYQARTNVLIFLYDMRNDGVGQWVKFYNYTKSYRTSWGPYFLRYYRRPRVVRINCRIGDKICYGAWQYSRYWGCGYGCKRYCHNCCFRCLQGAVKRIWLY